MNPHSLIEIYRNCWTNHIAGYGTNLSDIDQQLIRTKESNNESINKQMDGRQATKP